MKCFHGTTSKGLAAIKSGTNNKPTGPWVCSDNDGLMYVWPVDKLDEPDEPEQGIQLAFESAQIQAVMTGDFDLYVLELDIHENYLDDDVSCENMADRASSLYASDFELAMIQKIYHFKMNQWFAPFVVAGLLENEYFNKYSIDEALILAAECVSGQFLDEVLEFDYIEIDTAS